MIYVLIIAVLIIINFTNTTTKLGNFNGLLDEFKIYNYVLSASEINSFFENRDTLINPLTYFNINTNKYQLNSRLIHHF